MVEFQAIMRANRSSSFSLMLGGVRDVGVRLPAFRDTEMTGCLTNAGRCVRRDCDGPVTLLNEGR
jgi:hypothetical protein